MASQRGVSLPGGAGGGLRRGRGLGDAAADADPDMLLAGMETLGGGAADWRLHFTYTSAANTGVSLTECQPAICLVHDDCLSAEHAISPHAACESAVKAKPCAHLPDDETVRMGGGTLAREGA